ncbi:hypothetical protein R1sor_012608 [Riccia sorocarpa]|uniref:LisH domain-containing protein n=1 Tax=Riccia sorocarpa TaxID=122646 RepID=A0ABD3I8A0_9MARC
MGSSKVELQRNAEKAFHYFIHDYMLRKKYDNSAMTFSMETAALPQPTILKGGTVSIENSDDGFLWDWWVIFADVYFAHMKQRQVEFEASLSPQQLQQFAAATHRQLLHQQQQQQSCANINPAAFAAGRATTCPCSPRPGPVKVHKGQQQQRKWGPVHLQGDTGMRRLVLHKDNDIRSSCCELKFKSDSISQADAGITRSFRVGGRVRKRLDFSHHNNLHLTRSASTADSRRQLLFQQSPPSNGLTVPGDSSTGNASQTNHVPYNIIPPSPSVSNSITLQYGGRNDSSQLTGNTVEFDFNYNDSNNHNVSNNMVIASSSSPQQSWPSSSLSSPPEWPQVPLVIASPRPPLSLGVGMDLSPPAEGLRRCQSSCWSSDPQQLSSSSNLASAQHQVNVLPGTPSTSCNNNVVSHPPEDGNDQMMTTAKNEEETLGVLTGFHGHKSTESGSLGEDESRKDTLDVVQEGSQLDKTTNSNSKDQAEAAGVATASEQAEDPSSLSTVTINHEKDSILKRMKQLARSRCQSKTASPFRQKQRRVIHRGGGNAAEVEGKAVDILHVEEGDGNTHGRAPTAGAKMPLGAESKSLAVSGDHDANVNVKRNDPTTEQTSAKAENTSVGTVSISEGVPGGSIYSPRGSESMLTEQESAPPADVQPSSSDVLLVLPAGTNENNVGCNDTVTVETPDELEPFSGLGLGEVAESLNSNAASLDLLFAELGVLLGSECSGMDKLWPDVTEDSGAHDGENLDAKNVEPDWL